MTASQMGSIQANKARAISAVRFNRFEETEKSVKKENYEVFYTSNEPVAYHKENRFEGKSNYQFYYPTGETYEQELEKFWFDEKNKELADKRRDEEAREIMKEWGLAHGRMESEIARKKEHLSVATNFERARGWKRKCFKTKNMRPVETLDEFLMPSSSEDSMIDNSDNDMASPSHSPNKKIDFNPPESAAKVIDLTEDHNTYNLRPTTEQEAHQLNAIEDFNNKLPPKKKAKESLPEITSTNINRKTLMTRDMKKNTIGFAYKYNCIGAVDDAKFVKND